ncbi:MAG: hypothetical protein HONBIEJF_00658 [Fimbriimonadaceae bacterium]|nr:hypothetical protein [Fimbriimonadaceae bacterium]
MIAAALLAVATNVKPDLELRLVLVPASAPSGTVVEANLVVKNLSKRPIPLTRAVWDGGLCARAWIEVFLDGKRVEVTGGDSSSPYLQVGEDFQVTSDRFHLVMPGSSSNVYWIKFDRSIPSGSPRPSGKGDYSKWLKTALPLSAGKYEIRGYYEFRKPDRHELGGENGYEFTPTALNHFRNAFVGKLQATGSLSITK